jgi:hypothetical protein
VDALNRAAKMTDAAAGGATMHGSVSVARVMFDAMTGETNITDALARLRSLGFTNLSEATLTADISFGAAVLALAMAAGGAANLGPLMQRMRTLAATPAGHGAISDTLNAIRYLSDAYSGSMRMADALSRVRGLASITTGHATELDTLGAARPLSDTIIGEAHVQDLLGRLKALAAGIRGDATLTNSLVTLLLLSMTGSGHGSFAGDFGRLRGLECAAIGGVRLADFIAVLRAFTASCNGSTDMLVDFQGGVPVLMSQCQCIVTSEDGELWAIPRRGPLDVVGDPTVAPTSGSTPPIIVQESPMDTATLALLAELLLVG